MLQRAGFEVAVASDGLMGVEMWEGGNFDLILMDVQMPRMNGFMATRAIREKKCTAKMMINKKAGKESNEAIIIR